MRKLLISRLSYQAELHHTTQDPQMPGRRAKPTHLKLIQGNPGRRPIDAAREPTPMRATLAPPAHLAGLSREAWIRFARILDTMGVLTTADGDALERLCETYAEIREASRVIEIEGTTYQTRTVTGEIMWRARPEVAQRADADRRFVGMLAHFGLTPAARTKVKVTDASKTDPIENYFAN